MGKLLSSLIIAAVAAALLYSLLHPRSPQQERADLQHFNERGELVDSLP